MGLHILGGLTMVQAATVMTAIAYLIAYDIRGRQTIKNRPTGPLEQNS